MARPERIPPQHLPTQPGHESQMSTSPQAVDPEYRGSGKLKGKGAIVAFTRSLADQLVDKKIRVNGVAPGPVWTPLIPATFKPEAVEKFGQKYPMGRPGQPEEIAPSYVFLASRDSSFMSGQILHPNGGEVVNG